MLAAKFASPGAARAMLFTFFIFFLFVIATMGKAISAYQINEIIKSPVERIIILLDPDAKEQAINLALKLVSYKKVKVVYLPDEKDCNDLGRKKVFRYICSTHYQDYNDLMQLKNEL